MTRFFVGRDDQLAERQWSLVVTRGPDEGKRVPLRQQTEMIGVSPSATLTLRDDTVSRYHSEVDLFAHRLRVRDLNSTNGTRNARGKPRATVWVGSTDRFFVGETEIMVQHADRPLSPGLPEPASDALNGLVAHSRAARTFFHRLRRIAESDGDLTIEGSPGSGRRTAARALHDHRGEPNQPFEVVDISRDGVDASADRLQPTRGTVVVVGADRLSPAEAQHLAGQLESVPVGPRYVAVVERAGLLDDLLQQRFGALVACVPRLEDRAADIPDLIERFASRRAAGRPRFGPDTVATIEARSWPGQLSELARMVDSLAEGHCDALDDRLAEVAAVYWSEHVRAAGGNISAISQSVGLPARTIFHALSHFAIDVD